MLKTGVFLVLLTLLLAEEAHPQYFLTGQDPASVKWKQIKTENFQLIFPQGYESVAQYYINTLEMTSPFVAEPYSETRKRVSVILHNQTTTSNALVAIAPMRSEFYEMPPQDIYPQPWPDQLALHEYRHVVQINQMRQAMTKVMYYIFGEQALAAVMGLYLPFWFIEGDAVLSETLYSKSGRGREPKFIYPLKAQVLEKKIYKYDKAIFGSFRDFVPDHYTLGYQLVAKGVEEYGIELWDFALDRVARRPWMIVPVNSAIHKKTGLWKVPFYKHTMKTLQAEWAAIDTPELDEQFETLSPQSRFFTNYLFPVALSDGSVITEKTGIDDINRFVKISPDGKEKRLFTPGFDFRNSLSFSDSVICWNEKTFDPRWSMRNYSVIKTYNLKTGKQKKLTKRSRYFAPALSHDGKRIVTVHVSNESQYSLHILDAESGEVLQEIATEDNLFFMTPHWSDKDAFIVAMVMGKNGKSLAKIHTKNWEVEYVLPFSFTEIKWPVMHGNWIVYTGAYEGKDNLYALHLVNRQIYRVADARFGAVHASFSADGKTLYFSNYTADGYRAAKMGFKPADFLTFSPKANPHQYLADKLVTPETFILEDTIKPNKEYPTNKYSKAGHLFNLHSWMPLSVDVDNFSLYPGATLLSQNKLSTAVTTLAYLYDPNEQTGKVKFGFDYYGWYPILKMAVDYGGRRANVQDSLGNIESLHWMETTLSLDVNLPLTFTSSKWIKGIEPSVGIDQIFRKMDANSKYDFKQANYTTPVYRFFGYNQYKRSPKDLYPKWGQNINLTWRHTLFADNNQSQLGAIAWFYLPGIVRHQGLKLYGAYQKDAIGTDETSIFGNLVSTPRGYFNVDLPEFISLKADYAFPIAYPDWDVPGVFYLKRITSTLFYDFLSGNNQVNQAVQLASGGMELYTDWNFFSFLATIRLGVRVSYQFNVIEAKANNIGVDDMNYEFLFGISY
ncbi:MAG: hypothetical protein L3J66_03490 [Bacteroidales bacterium]|nr:hypothetical protein [Bacteroidales bacterium]